MGKCTCEKPGYCLRRSRKMYKRQWHQCRNSQDFFNLFDRVWGVTESHSVTKVYRGIGDVVAKGLKVLGANKLANAYTRITGKPCGCEERQDALNKMFPFSSQRTER